jgi:hypothetical protein
MPCLGTELEINSILFYSILFCNRMGRNRNEPNQDFVFADEDNPDFYTCRKGGGMHMLELGDPSVDTMVAGL